MEIEVRRADQEDEAFLAQLFKEVHAAELIPAALPDVMAAQLLEMQFRGQMMSYQAQFPEGESSIVWLGPERIGRLYVNETLEELRVVDIALSAGYRGRGFGRRLLEEVGHRASAKGVPVRLSVRPGAAAVRLYERVGFVPVSSTDTHVEMEWSAGSQSPAEQAQEPLSLCNSIELVPWLDDSSASFRSLLGKELRVDLQGGVQAKLCVSEVQMLETKQPGIITHDSFAVMLEGPTDAVLAPATHKLVYGEGQSASSLLIFLSPLGARGNLMQYQAVFNRMTLASEVRT